MASRRLRVLVAEDDLVYVKRVKNLLQPSFHVSHVESLAELIDFKHKETIDAVLLDLGLPDTHDFDTGKLVDSVVKDFPGSAVIVLTGDENRSKALLARSVGAKDYIFKGTESRSDLRMKIEDAVAVLQGELRRQLSRESGDNMSAQSMQIDYAELLKHLRPELTATVKAARKPKTGPQDPPPIPTYADRVKSWLGNNWKFLAGLVLAAGTYMIDFRDRIRDYTADMEEYRASTSEAVNGNTTAIDDLSEKQQTDVDRLERAIIRQQVLSVESTEQLQREIRAANPRAEIPEDTPELAKAKRQVREVKARKLLEDDDPTAE